ncbi:MAG: hypothetical protein GTN53_18310 [Candidatus Aminicenantes bacterium]|nr:hypothetical protein [Candidatus Aminicenantes bacterium]NIQ68403.1 hypothetical protein [Candidatus Aminicenantes bacterium]NIT24451.1 hypothetical protein [Candidatus Aminicenantes bacterium]
MCGVTSKYKHARVFLPSLYAEFQRQVQQEEMEVVVVLKEEEGVVVAVAEEPIYR